MRKKKLVAYFVIHIEITREYRDKSPKQTYQTYKIKFFAKIVNGFQLLNIFAKSSILGVWLDSECACPKLLVLVHM